MADLASEDWEGRLVRLTLITADDAADMAAHRRRPWFAEGYPRPDDTDAAAMATGDADTRGWGPRHIIRRSDGCAVGTIGFFGPPDDAGLVEIGYGLIASARRAGLITEALTIAVAAAHHAGATVIAHTSPDNAASQAALRRCGFAEVGIDASGELRFVH